MPSLSVSAASEAAGELGGASGASETAAGDVDCMARRCATRARRAQGLSTALLGRGYAPSPSVLSPLHAPSVLSIATLHQCSPSLRSISALHQCCLVYLWIHLHPHSTNAPLTPKGVRARTSMASSDSAIQTRFDLRHPRVAAFVYACQNKCDVWRASCQWVFFRSFVCVATIILGAIKSCVLPHLFWLTK